LVSSLLIYAVSFLLSIAFVSIYQRKYPNTNNGIYTLNNESQKLSLLWIIVIVGAPVFIATVRSGVGTDYYNYVSIFNASQNLSFLGLIDNSMGEPLFLIVNRLIGLIFNELGMFFFVTIFMMIFVLKTADYYKNHLNMGAVLFIFYLVYYSTSLNIVRQMLAVAIVLYAYRYILEKKLVWYVFLVLVAAQFHSSAYICLLFYLVGFKRDNLSLYKRTMYYISVICSLILIAPLIENITKLPIFSKYLETYTINYSGGGFGFLILILPVLIPILLFRKQIVNQSKRYEVLIDLLFLQIPLQFSGYFSEFAHRLTIYPAIIQVILVPLLVTSIKDKSLRFLLGIYYTFWYTGYYYYYYYLMNTGEVYPYRWIFW
jgi:transmembrane protein EpsG